MSQPDQDYSFEQIYYGFSLPLSEIDCGMKCGPFNEYGVPVCCDINILVPAAYHKEWVYLKNNSDLWQLWHSPLPEQKNELNNDLQGGQVLLECKGYQHCQRNYRTITCRAFPFYPYLASRDEFAGMAYYQDFREQCWIISNLDVVSLAYKKEFQKTFQDLFDFYPNTRRDYFEYSIHARKKAALSGQNLILLDFSGKVFRVDPDNEELIECHYNDLDAFGPFEITRELLFPDEEEHQTRSH
jgi:hypothetical protein